MTVLNSLLFVELTRLSSTTAICRIYADANYSDLLESSGVQTIPNALTLRFLNIWAENTDGTANGEIEQTFDDVEFWNGRSTTCDVADSIPWISTDPSNIFVDICQENIVFQNMMIQSDEQNITLDLGALLSNVKFVLRWSMFFGELDIGVATNMFIGMSDKDQNFGAADAQDFILSLRRDIIRYRR